MPVKEYRSPGYCEIHDEKLYHTGDEYSDWYSCKSCEKKANKDFWAHISKVSDDVRLWPKWKGGEGVLCPCCKGNGYVAPEVADEYRRD